VEVDIQCPSCGEPTAVVVDEVGGRWVEDCTVCCRPIEIHTRVDEDGEPQVSGLRSDE
jgi:hypothetical protein